MGKKMEVRHGNLRSRSQFPHCMILIPYFTSITAVCTMYKLWDQFQSFRRGLSAHFLAHFP